MSCQFLSFVYGYCIDLLYALCYFSRNWGEINEYGCFLYIILYNYICLAIIFAISVLCLFCWCVKNVKLKCILCYKKTLLILLRRLHIQNYSAIKCAESGVKCILYFIVHLYFLYFIVCFCSIYWLYSYCIYPPVENCFMMLE